MEWDFTDAKKATERNFANVQHDKVRDPFVSLIPTRTGRVPKKETLMTTRVFAPEKTRVFANNKLGVIERLDAWLMNKEKDELQERCVW